VRRHQAGQQGQVFARPLLRHLPHLRPAARGLPREAAAAVFANTSGRRADARTAAAAVFANTSGRRADARTAAAAVFANTSGGRADARNAIELITTFFFTTFCPFFPSKPPRLAQLPSFV